MTLRTILTLWAVLCQSTLAAPGVVMRSSAAYWRAKIWGWDYPMIAMTAARLHAPELAVDVLLKTDGPNNAYTAAGHNPNTKLPMYLPGNSALLAAVALMAGARGRLQATALIMRR